MQRQSTEEEVAINYRDVGWSVNQSYNKLKHGSSRILKENVLYRSGALNDNEPYELHKMLEERSIHTVIKLSSDLNSNVVITVRTEKSSNPTEFPEYTTLKEIQVGGGRFKRKGVWEPASHTTKRMAAVDALHGHFKEIKQLFTKQIFSILSDTDSLPALIHCEQGKDRTGVVVALILSACGVDREVILDDYGKSREGLYPQYNEVKDEMNGLGLNDEFAHTEPEALQEMFDHLDRTYTPQEFFIEKCQISPDVLTKVQQNLMMSQ